MADLTERQTERLLDARIDMTTVVRLPATGWQARYCDAIDRVARHYGVSAGKLAHAFFRYHNLPVVWETAVDRHRTH